MNITQEMLEGQEARITIDIQPADYNETYTKELKKLAKKVQINGFRTGEVPKGVVQKMYGKSILLDELNKIVSTELEKYLTENKINILGNPLPVPLAEFDHDFNSPTPYVFSFDIGLAPQFEFVVPSKAIDYYDIMVTQKEIDESIKHLTEKYGDFAEPEIADANCSVFGALTQLNEDGTENVEGIKRSTYIFLEYVKDQNELAKFIDKKVGDSLTFNPKKAFDSDAELMHVLDIKREKAEAMTFDFNFEVERIHKRVPAVVDQNLFDKVFGPEKINSQEEFIEHTKADIKTYFDSRSNAAFAHLAEHVLLDEYNFPLPDSFLKRWIKTVNEKPVTDEQLEKEYNSYANEMRLRMIYNRIFSDNKMNIEDNEIREEAAIYMRGMFEQYGMQQLPENFHTYIDNFLAEEKNVNRMYEAVEKRKVNHYLVNAMHKNIIPVTLDEFELAQSEHRHHHHE